MRITKKSLYNFINKKIVAEKNKAVQQKDDYIEKNIKPVLEKNTEALTHFKNSLTKLADELQSFIEANVVDDWESRRSIRDLNYLSNVRSRIITDNMANIEHALKREMTYDSYGMYDTVEQAHKDLAPLYKKLEDLSTLHRELERAIKAGISGKDAYKNLVSLGVDMEEYKGADEHLPATVKVSVDPCLINKGGCADET